MFMSDSRAEDEMGCDTVKLGQRGKEASKASKKERKKCANSRYV